MTAFRCLDHTELVLVLSQLCLSLCLSPPGLGLRMVHLRLDLKMTAFNVLAKSLAGSMLRSRSAMGRG